MGEKMKRLVGLLVVAAFLLVSANVQAARKSTSDYEWRIKELEEKVTKLEEEKEVGGNSGYDHGFFVRSSDNNFMFKMRFWAQIFYRYDGMVNAPDVSTFGLARARWLLTGHVFDPKLTFAIMPELTSTFSTMATTYTTSDGATVTVNDRNNLNWRLYYLWAQYNFSKALHVRFGEFIPKSERFYRYTNQIFMSNLPLISVTQPFVAGFHIGANVFGTIKKKFYYDFYAVNASTFDRPNVNKSILTGMRLRWNAMGKDDMSSSDLAYSEKPVISVSATGSYERADGNTPARGNRGDNAFRFGGDAAFKYKGFSFVPEVIFFWNKTQSIKHYAFYGALGYFVIPHHLELAAQGTYLKFQGPQNDRHEYSGGLNYYFHGQPVKLQADYSYLLTQIPGADMKDHRFRVNLQIGFF
jgi:hypothetical protein